MCSCLLIIIELAGMSLWITQPAPMITLSPMVTPFSTITLLPSQQFFPILMGAEFKDALAETAFFQIFGNAFNHFRRTQHPDFIGADFKIGADGFDLRGNDVGRNQMHLLPQR